jgi:hypothetical protein
MESFVCCVCPANKSDDFEASHMIGTLIPAPRGHCHLKGHLFKLGLTDDPTCERCLQEDESATHILCDCEAIAYLRFRHLGQFCMEPSDFYDAPIIKVLHFIRSVGLING